MIRHAVPTLVALGTCLLAGCAQVQAAESVWDVRPDTWVARDGIGRELPTHADVGAPRAHRDVGIFYFVWHKPWEAPPHPQGILPNNNTEYLLRDTYDRDGWGGPQCYWAEPEDGFYKTTDPYIIRKHAAMLSAAGIDVLYLDATNTSAYLEQVEAIVTEFDRLNELGWETPKIGWLADAEHLPQLFTEIYQPGKWQDHWYYWEGKPLVLWENDSGADTITDAMRAELSLRFAWFNTGGEDEWSWLHLFPQKWGWTEHPLLPEAMPVGVGSHPAFNVGRSNTENLQPLYDPQLMVPGTEAEGLFHQEQWDEALRTDPPFIFHTGWNEWIAAHYPASDTFGWHMLGHRLSEGDYTHVDSFNTEYNRDAEPMLGGYGDVTYYQMMANVRRYKGAELPPASNGPHSITIDGSFDDWAPVAPEYRDYRGDAAERDYGSVFGPLRYVNTSGRNDIRLAKATFDEDFVTFLVETEEPITAPEGPAWMNLLVNTDRDFDTGWEGFDLAVNRGRNGGTATVHRATGSAGEFQWNTAPIAGITASTGERVPTLDGANWIWADGEVQDANVLVSKSFTLSEPQPLHLLVTAHGEWRVDFNGNEIASGTNYNDAALVDLGNLPAGEHRIDAHVAEKTRIEFPWGEPKNGFIAKVIAAGGELVTDGSWMVQREGESSATNAVEVGAFGIQPWGRLLPALPVATVTHLDLGGGEAWFEVPFGAPQRIRRAEVRFFADDEAFDGGALRAPADWRIEYKQGDEWDAVPNPERKDLPRVPNCAQVRFDEVESDALRFLFRGSLGERTGLSEIRVESYPVPAGGAPAWDEAGEARFAVSGNRMEIAVPRALFADAGAPPQFYFKWVDNWQRDFDSTEFAINGDAAPDRRAAYQFVQAQAPVPARGVDRRLRVRTTLVEGVPTHPHSFTDVESLGQTFVAELHEMAALKMNTPTWGRIRPLVDVRVDLLRDGPGGELLFSTAMPKDRIADGATRVNVDLEVEQGATYYVRLAPMGDPPAESLGWWRSLDDQYADGRGYINDVPAGHDFLVDVEYFLDPVREGNQWRISGTESR